MMIMMKIKKSCINYWGVNNLYGWSISQNLPVNNNEGFIKNYNEESDEGYFLEVYVQYPEK